MNLFDKFLKNMLDEFSKDKIQITKDFLNPKYNRYCSFEERFESKCMLSNQVRTNVLSETFSQGTHSATRRTPPTAFPHIEANPAHRHPAL